LAFALACFFNCSKSRFPQTRQTDGIMDRLTDGQTDIQTGRWTMDGRSC